MDYEFVGSFSEDERERVVSALSHVEGARLLGSAPIWTVYNTQSGGIPFYMAVSHRAARGGPGPSFHGGTVDELVAAIKDYKAPSDLESAA
jgi:hypothetical protein